MFVIPSGFPSVGTAYASFNEQKFKFIGFTYRGEVSHEVHDVDKNVEAKHTALACDKLEKYFFFPA